jgi:hypothetical protein
MDLFKYFLATICALLSSLCLAGQYEAGIVCPGSPTLTDVKYLSANNDFDAQGQVREMLYNNTQYKGRKCSIKYLKNTSGKSTPQKDRSYELGIICEKSSNIASVKYFSAKSDLDAENEARDIIRNNTEFSNQRCEIKYLKQK